MDLRQLDPMLAAAMAKQQADLEAEKDMPGYRGVRARMLLAIAEVADGAITEEMMRRSEPAALLTAATIIASRMLVMIIANSPAMDDSMVCTVAKLLHGRMHKELDAIRQGNTEGVRLQAREGRPLVVTPVGPAAS